MKNQFSVCYRILLLPWDQLKPEQKLQVNMACAGACALCSLSQSNSKPNKEVMRKCGLVPLMSRLLKSVHIDLIIPIMGTFQNCSTEVNKLLNIIYFAFCMTQMMIGKFHFERKIFKLLLLPKTWCPTLFIICIPKIWKLNYKAVWPFLNVPLTK